MSDNPISQEQPARLAKRGWIRRHPKGVAIASTAAVAAMIAATGIAYAAWNASSSGGSGGAVASSAPVVTAQFGGTGTYTQLYPGVSTGGMLVQVQAPSQYGVTVTGFSVPSGSITGTGGSGSCTTTGVTLNTQNSSSKSLGTSVNIAAGQSFYFLLTGALSMSNSSDPGCAGATFTIPLTAVATSSPGATSSSGGTSSSPDTVAW